VGSGGDDPTYTGAIETAVRVGSAVLVEEALDAGLQFVLAPKLQRQSGRLVPRFGSTSQRI
jgi:hypothetical protein